MLAPKATTGVAFMMLCKNDRQQSIFFPLYADNFSRNPALSGGNARSYSLRFHTEAFAAMIAGSGLEAPVKEISNVNFLCINLNFLPKNSEILGGTAEILVNGNIRKMFRIFPQIDTNPPDRTPNFPYTVIATNVVQTPEK
jgi:hypothetical protein